MSLRTGAGTPWHLDRGRRAGEMGYLPGLDGIRAVAIIGVLLYHADLDWLPGGFLGVDVFFVLSGFLITTLILEEFDRSGRIDFGRFYLGRARRLLPALVLLLVVCGIAVALVYKDGDPRTVRATIAAFFSIGVVITVTGFVLSGEIGRHELALTALIMPGVIGGLPLSSVLAKRMSADVMRPLILALCGISATLLFLETAL